MYSRRTMLISYLASLCLVFLFQNCSAPDGVSGQNQTDSHQSLNANGEGYTGKFTIDAPESMAPGETVVLDIRGGTGPFNLALTEGNGLFQQVTLRKYLFTLDSQNQGPQVSIRASDANGLNTDVSILILGVNRWFFESITQISSFDSGQFVLMDEKARQISFLDRKGNEKGQLSLASYPHLIQSRAMVGYDNRLVFLQDSNLDFLDIENKTLESIELPGACTNPKDLTVLLSKGLILSCEELLWLYDTKSHQFQILGVHPSNLTHWSASEAQLFGLSLDGQFAVASLVGEFKFETGVLSGLDLPYMGSLDVTDFMVLGDKLFVLNGYKRHLLIFNLAGNLIEKVSLNGTGVGSVHSLSQIAQLSDDEIAVVDPHRRSVLVMSTEGEWIRTIGASNYFESTFNQPNSIETSGDGEIFVLDSANKRLQIFSAQGEHLRSVDSRTLSGGAWWTAEGMDLLENRLAVANTYRQVVQIYNLKNFDLITSIGENDGIDLSQPHSVKLFGEDIVYVADAKNQRILIYNGKNNYRFFGKFGSGPDEFKHPIDIEIYENQLYILDRNTGTVKVFSMEGLFVREISFSSLGGLNFPSDIDIDSRGQIVLADTYNRRILLHDLASGESKVLLNQSVFGMPFSEVKGLNLRDDGSLVIADTGHHRVIIVPDIHSPEIKNEVLDP